MTVFLSIIITPPSMSAAYRLHKTQAAALTHCASHVEARIKASRAETDESDPEVAEMFDLALNKARTPDQDRRMVEMAWELMSEDDSNVDAHELELPTD